MRYDLYAFLHNNHNHDGYEQTLVLIRTEGIGHGTKAVSLFHAYSRKISYMTRI